MSPECGYVRCVFITNFFIARRYSESLSTVCFSHHLEGRRTKLFEEDAPTGQIKKARGWVSDLPHLIQSAILQEYGWEIESVSCALGFVNVLSTVMTNRCTTATFFSKTCVQA